MFYSTLALVKLFMTGDQRLGSLTVPVEAKSLASPFKYATRSQTTSKVEYIPFPVRALFLIIEGYIKHKESSDTRTDIHKILYGDSDEEYSDDEDDEDDDENGSDDGIDDGDDGMGGAFAGEDDDDDDENVYAKGDPMTAIKLEEVLPPTIKGICAKYPQLAQMVANYFDDSQKKVFFSMLQ